MNGAFLICVAVDNDVCNAEASWTLLAAAAAKMSNLSIMYIL
jgi:hypothetical protein